MISTVIRRLAIVGSPGHGAVLVFTFLCFLPGMQLSHLRASVLLLFVACLLPPIGVIRAIFRPGQGVIFIAAGVGAYSLAHIAATLEQLADSGRIEPSWGVMVLPLLLFVIPPGIFATAIWLTSRKSVPEQDQAARSAKQNAAPASQMPAGIGAPAMILLLFMARMACAGPAGLADLSRVTEKADVIVVARVAEGSMAGGAGSGASAHPLSEGIGDGSGPYSPFTGIGTCSGAQESQGAAGYLVPGG